MHRFTPLLPARLRSLLRRAIYPLLCLLSLALLPYQPEDQPAVAAAQLAQGLAVAHAPAHTR